MENEAQYLQQEFTDEGDYIDAGDYVRIVEDADLGDKRLLELRDKQAIFLARHAASASVIIIQWHDEGYWLKRTDAYLVDVDKLPGEMTEIMADDATTATGDLT